MTSSQSTEHVSRWMRHTQDRARRPSVDASATTTAKPKLACRPSWHLPPSIVPRAQQPTATTGVLTRLAAKRSQREQQDSGKAPSIPPTSTVPLARSGIATMSKPRTSFYNPTASNSLYDKKQSDVKPLTEKVVRTVPKPALVPQSSTECVGRTAASSTKPAATSSKSSATVTTRSQPTAAVSNVKTAAASSTTSTRVNYTIDDFQIGKPLGRGRFGNVYLVQEKATGFVCAMKVLFKSQIKQYELTHQVTREVEIQRKLRHRHILRMHAYFYDTTRIFMILDVAPKGELYKLLQKVKTFNEKTSAQYTYQIASALDYCHTRNVIHRDLKPENILISSSGELKVSDFGWSAYTAKGGESRSTHCGTPDYQAPEMIINGSTHDLKVDIWSLGCMLYEFLHGKPPFETKEIGDTQRRIRACHYAFPIAFPANAAKLVKQLVVLDSHKRLPASQIMTNSWIIEMKGDKYN